MAAQPTRYERLADDMAQAIRDGLLQPGDRLPSVRETCLRRSLSPATVFQAYDLLEGQGLIEARPRSGFYVRPQARRLAVQAAAVAPRPDSTEVAISELVFEVLHRTRDRDVVPLGSAFPSPM